jgi:cell division protein FtsX
MTETIVAIAIGMAVVGMSAYLWIGNFRELIKQWEEQAQEMVAMATHVAMQTADPHESEIKALSINIESALQTQRDKRFLAILGRKTAERALILLAQLKTGEAGKYLQAHNALSASMDRIGLKWGRKIPENIG